MDLGLEVEFPLGRLDLSNGGLEGLSTLGTTSLDGDHGLVGGHVAERDTGLGEALRDGGVHRVDIDNDAGADMREESRSRHSGYRPKCDKDRAKVKTRRKNDERKLGHKCARGGATLRSERSRRA